MNAAPQPLTDAELAFVRRHEATVCCCEKAANHVSPKQYEEWGEPGRISEARWLATIDALKGLPRVDDAMVERAIKAWNETFRGSIEDAWPDQLRKSLTAAIEAALAAPSVHQLNDRLIEQTAPIEEIRSVEQVWFACYWGSPGKPHYACVPEGYKGKYCPAHMENLTR